MIQRKGPDGKVYQFQDGTSEQVMIDAFSSIYNKPELTIPEKAAGTARSVGQGLSVGSLDEGMAALGAFAQTFIPEGLSPYSTEYDQNFEAIQKEESQKVKEFREQEPLLSIGGEITGAILSPAAKLLQVGKFTSLKPTGKAGLDAMAFAMPYAFLASDGSVLDRGKEAAYVAIPSLLFGAATQKVMNFGKGIYDKVFDKAIKTPTINNLKDSKTAAYKLTDLAGEKYSLQEINKLIKTAEQNLTLNKGYVAEVDTQANAALKILQAQAGNKDLTLTRLDKIRKDLWSRKDAGSPAEGELIRDMIDSVDDMMFAKTGASELMVAARQANSTYKKAELLDDAFNKAELQTASTGSGGNIFNKYRQAVTNIITNPKKSRWFKKEELDQMEKFVKGEFGDDVMRNIGKLSPSGNGLMTALNLGAFAVNPLMAFVTGGGIAAKMASDRGIIKKKEALESSIRGAPLQPYTQSRIPAPLSGGLLSPSD
tara:strand:+ start:762 stop:2210 length:1449 start_codon:yes stop_codon:yes gene_type:complete